MDKKPWLVTGALFLATVIVSTQISTVEISRAEEPAEQPTFVGVKKCKMCHKKETVGAQFRIWEESGHSGAYATLATPEAVEYGKARGIENPQTAPECLKCHSTAHALSAEALAASKITLEEGVSCESCHGAGSLYYKKKTMQGVTDGAIDATTVGLITPNEAVCVGCHNEESPAFEGFDLETYLEKIAHPRPEPEQVDAG